MLLFHSEPSPISGIAACLIQPRSHFCASGSGFTTWHCLETENPKISARKSDQRKPLLNGVDTSGKLWVMVPRPLQHLYLRLIQYKTQIVTFGNAVNTCLMVDFENQIEPFLWARPQHHIMKQDLLFRINLNHLIMSIFDQQCEWSNNHRGPGAPVI